MSLSAFIPEIWSARLEAKFFQSQRIISTVNGKYDGEIARGNTVKITGIVTPTIVDYAAANRVINPEDMGDDDLTLLINQEKAFSFFVDDIDRAQAAGDLGAWTDTAGAALAQDAEAYVAGNLLTQSKSLNVTGASPVTIDTSDKAKDALLTIREYLSENNVPEESRYAVVNPKFSSLLIKGLDDVSVAGGSNELRNGFVARIYGMDVIESPLLGDPTKPTAVGYHSNGVAFAGQIQAVEGLRAQNKFADIVRGLNVYGSRVIRQDLVASFVSGGVTANAANPFPS